jgi:hypothetical protein
MRAHPSRFVLATIALSAVLAATRAMAAGPTVGQCLAATETSLKLRTDHKLRGARTQALVCSAASCPAEVREECLHRVTEMNAAIPTVVFTVKGPSGDELAAVKVSMDGEVVATQLDGSAIALDAGSHRFTFEAEGAAPSSKTLIIHEGEKNRREAVALGPVAPTPPPAMVPAPAPEPKEPEPASPSIPGQKQRIAGIVVGGAGAVGLVVGGVFGGLTSASNERSSAVSDGAASTAAFVIGAVLVGGGAALYFLAPKEASQPAPTVGVAVGPGSLALRGTF